MNTRLMLIAVVSFGLLSGCSESADQQAAPVVETEVLEPVVEQMADSAAELEATALEATESLDTSMDEMAGDAEAAMAELAAPEVPVVQQ